jgi:protein-L-isoaspartate(D-aspartate) O-methyltransferase
MYKNNLIKNYSFLNFKIIIFIIAVSFFFLTFNPVSADSNDNRIIPEAKIMVNTQIKNRGIENEDVLNSMMRVKRHKLIPENMRNRAYTDRPLPIGYGQTISQPYIVAYMTEAIQPDSSHTVLEIGAGSGYQAAVLAEIVKQVYTIEIVEPLGKLAAERLRNIGYENIEVKLADGYYGWEEKGQFDAIVVTAAAPYIPPPLIEQLKDGGKMIIPVGTPFRTQYLMLVEKNDGEITTHRLLPVRFVPFTRSEQE